MHETAFIREEEPVLINEYKKHTLESISWVVNIYQNKLLPNMGTKQ